MKYKNIDVEDVYKIAVEAGNAIMQVYETAFAIESKEDKSPLTEADKQSHNIIEKGLLSLYPDVPVLSEESKFIDYSIRKEWKRFWLVDPLDGTKEFIKRNGDFTVNIALIEEGKSVLGIVYIPVSKVGYIGISGEGAFKIVDGDTEFLKPVTDASATLVRVVASRSHLSAETESFVNQLKEKGKAVEFLSRGSSLKLCMIAESSADVYPRFAPTMEWDTAAAQAVVEAAGRKVLAYPELVPLVYNKENLLNPWFIAQ